MESRVFDFVIRGNISVRIDDKDNARESLEKGLNRMKGEVKELFETCFKELLRSEVTVDPQEMLVKLGDVVVSENQD